MSTMNRKSFEVYLDLHDDMASEMPVGGVSVPTPNDVNAVARPRPISSLLRGRIKPVPSTLDVIFQKSGHCILV